MELYPPSKSCPDFDDLSCYADGELELARVADLTRHIDDCSRCAGLMLQLREGFDAPPQRRAGGIGGSGCADEERLILYLMRHLDDSERAAVETHLGHCDPCVYGLSLLQRRLRIEEVVDRPVPAALQERVRTMIEAGGRDLAESEAARRPTESWRSRLRERLDRMLRLPVLVPAAVAAGALLVVGVQESRRLSGGQPDDIRAVSQVADLRVKSLRAQVRELPNGTSPIVEVLRRGDLVRVAAEQSDWYRVVLPGDRTGWMAREAFE